MLMVLMIATFCVAKRWRQKPPHGENFGYLRAAKLTRYLFPKFSSAGIGLQPTACMSYNIVTISSIPSKIKPKGLGGPEPRHAKARSFHSHGTFAVSGHLANLYYWYNRPAAS